MGAVTQASSGGSARGRGVAAALGPAFVAAIAYVDPGNVASNMTAGITRGYALLWSLVAASAMAMIVQYLSAKLGIVTGKTLSSLVRDRLEDTGRLRLLKHAIFAGQAFFVAVATDIAELIGGALALNLLFGLPVWLGGIVVGLASFVVLSISRTAGGRVLEHVVTGILLVIVLGFLANLLWAPPNPTGVIRGLVPSLPGSGSLMLVAAMIGATVMPHAIYLHSELAIEHNRPRGELAHPVPDVLHAQRVDVVLALIVAGSVNVSMLLFAAAAFDGHEPSGDVVRAVHTWLVEHGGAVPATVFAIGLLASGVGSTIVGTHAGSGMMRDLVGRRVPPMVRRLCTLVPAVVLLWFGFDPTNLLVLSQLVLSFGIAFALVPLVWFTSDATLMGEYRNRRALRVAAWVVVGLILALNAAMLIGAVLGVA